MIIDDIYQSKLLKHPLSKEELDLVPEAWELLSVFKKRFLFITDYRTYLIKNISNKYTAEKFLKLESVINKMFWNLRWLLFPLWTNKYITKEAYLEFIKSGYGDFENLPYALLLCNSKRLPSSNKDELKSLLRDFYINTTFYRSFINKLVIIDKQNKNLITKPMEGSSDIFSKNYFNIMSFQILWSKRTYTEIMSNPLLVRDVSVVHEPHFYYQFDYGFPNLNYCKYQIGSDDDRINRIKKMYYTESYPKDKYWFKLII